jgi:hypothetical protein
LRASTALALVVLPYHLTFDGTAKIDATKAYAKDGGNGAGNAGGNGGGNAGGSGGGNAGGNGGNAGGSGGSNAGGNGGNAGGNSGNAGGNSSGKAGGNNAGRNTGKGNSAVKDADDGDTSSHVNAVTGDKVEVDGNKITVFHPNGMKEEIENGRFEMRDAFDRTIVERAATAADQARLKGLCGRGSI